MPKPGESFQTRNVDLTFIHENRTFAFPAQPLLKFRTVRDGIVECKADVELARNLLSGIPLPDANQATQAASPQTDGKGQLLRLSRGIPRMVLDPDETLKNLEKQLQTNPGSPTLNLPLVIKPAEDPGSFDSERKKFGFNLMLTSFETLHSGHSDDEGRNTNLRIAAGKIDGVVIQPGQEFSFNKTVGERNRKNGFQMAGVISNGKVIPGMGGGICQVSTTLYRNALLANLKILERYNHSIYDGIPYAQRGLDAAVVWGAKDFRIRNTLGFPILISASSGKGWVRVALFCEKKPFDKIEVVTRNEVKHPFEVQKKKNPKLKGNERKVVKPGVTGYTIDAYRIVTTNGVSREEKLSQDRYQTFAQIEEVND